MLWALGTVKNQKLTARNNQPTELFIILVVGWLAANYTPTVRANLNFMNPEEQLYNFFFNASNESDRYKVFNFLCDVTTKRSNKKRFSPNFINWIGKKSEMAEKIGVLKEYNTLTSELRTAKTASEKKVLKLKYNKNLNDKINEIKESLIAEWKNLVSNCHVSYNEYLKKLFETSTEIKYIIISEAPMLTTKDDNGKIVFDCKYIFSGSHKNIGSYRKVPFDAIQEINNCKKHNKDNPRAEDLINVFVKNRVLFLDLIPLPLPKIDSELRKNWSTNEDYFIDDEPRVITFLRCSLKYIFKDYKKIGFSKDVQIALMMPSNSALGIINYYLSCDNKLKNEPFKGKISYVKSKITRMNTKEDAKSLSGFSLRLHRQVAIGSQGGPEKELLIHALT